MMYLLTLLRNAARRIFAWFYAHATVLTLVLSIAALLLTVWQARSGAVLSAEQAKLQKDLNDKKELIDKEHLTLSTRMTQLGTSNSLQSIIETISHTSKEFSGSATIQKDGKTLRVDSKEAIRGYFPQDERKLQRDGTNTAPRIPFNQAETGVVKQFVPDEIPISLFDSLIKVLDTDPAYKDLKSATGKNMDLKMDYIAPMILPRCKSEDPAIAASSLIVCSLLVPKVEERAQFLALKDAFKGRNYSKVVFEWPKCDLSHFAFDNCLFINAIIKDVDLSESSLIGATFHGSTLENVKMTSVKASAVSASDALAFKPTQNDTEHFVNCHFKDRKCADFSHAHLVDTQVVMGGNERSTFSICSFASCELRGSVSFEGADLVGCDFTSATSPDGKVRFVDCNLSKAIIKLAILPDVQFNPGNSGRGCVLSQAQIQATELKGCVFNGAIMEATTFLGCDLTAAKFIGTRLDASVFGPVLVPGAKPEDKATERLSHLNGVKFQGGTRKAGGAGKKAEPALIVSSAKGAKFRCAFDSASSFIDYDLSGADFVGVDPEAFRQIAFENVNLTFAVVPYSDAFVSDIESEMSQRFVPNNIIVDPDCCILAVAVVDGKRLLKGVVHVKKTPTEKFLWQPDSKGAAFNTLAQSLAAYPKLGDLKIDKNMLLDKATSREVIGKVFDITFEGMPVTTSALPAANP
jgi:uncharacterized protein YjbI with pentapeptide repeats